MRKNLYSDLYALEETHWWHRAKRDLCEIYLRKIQKKKRHMRLLDIGCGTGGNMQSFAKFGKTYGVDISKEAIRFCKQRKLTRVRLGSAHKTRYASSSFDVITMLDVLEHVDDKKTLREVRRLLRPGGLLILTVPAHKMLWSRWDEALHHKRRYEKKELYNLLASSQFRVLKITHVYSFLFFPVLFIRSLKARNSKAEYPSDFSMNNGFLNGILLFVSHIEQSLLRYIHIPFGTSIFCVAEVQ
ncbi:MAG: class I SAM-dependent methyltransferase [Candidatus Levybacteria bacterium]|nr:class I SAM-dependent methyltransferase [Candidatus Levybacteria bacterium]